MSKVGRPKIEVDWQKVDEMARIQCTGEEMASVLGFSYDTLERRCKEDFGINFADYMATKAPAGKASLRRRQYKAAMEGNATMLVWLGKQYLGQKDKHEVEQKSSDPIQVKVINPYG